MSNAQLLPQTLEPLQSLTTKQAQAIAETYGSPVYVYSAAILEDRARQARNFSAPYGLTVRYAMKANPLGAILRLFDTAGLHMDASSEFEVRRAIAVGIKPDHIMLTSQELAQDVVELVEQGVIFNATSLHQLEAYGRALPGTSLSIRINPGLGSGHTHGTSTGGPLASFGIWHEYLPAVKDLLRKYNLKINRLHSHIGCGTDPGLWHQAAEITLGLAELFPEVSTINLGGGLKVARMSNEHATDLDSLSQGVAKLFEKFAHKTGRQLHLEIEPGTFLVTNAGAIVARVIDIVDTGPSGFQFLKLNTGLTEIMRPALYGAQHPIIVVNDRPEQPTDYVVVGHTCESSDLLTPAPGHTDIPAARTLQRAEIGDVVVIEGTGAYCSALSGTGYNSFPVAAEVMLEANGETTLVKQSLGLEHLMAGEVITQ